MKRIYELVIKNHLQENRQMIFIEGARQVGKTTLAKKVIDKNYYLKLG
ncbi:AAA domain protein [Rickettsia endosymbiont of Ixodes pacificus]|nr:AAA family ATPase [Rickettsia endosymbiont of Ixodes pacificus]KJW02492.1 AAA domain protein [Rickettsia endosymbiont of Ixodes pacificus]